MGHSPAMAKRQQRVSNLRVYAVIGAEQRLLQIAEEARAIFKAFPELGRQSWVRRSRWR